MTKYLFYFTAIMLYIYIYIYIYGAHVRDNVVERNHMRAQLNLCYTSDPVFQDEYLDAWSSNQQSIG